MAQVLMNSNSPARSVAVLWWVAGSVRGDSLVKANEEYVETVGPRIGGDGDHTVICLR